MSPYLVAFGILLVNAILGVIVCVQEDRREHQPNR